MARNAITYGLLSRDTLLPGEDPQALESLAEAVRAEWEPQGTHEQFQIDLMVRAMWRLQRLARVESGVFSAQAEYVTRLGDEPTIGFTSISGSSEPDAFSKLHRYEAMIERSYCEALHELERLQRARRGEYVPPPLAVDVTVNGEADHAAPAGAPEGGREEAVLP